MSGEDIFGSLGLKEHYTYLCRLSARSKTGVLDFLNQICTYRRKKLNMSDGIKDSLDGDGTRNNRESEDTWRSAEKEEQAAGKTHDITCIEGAGI